MEGCPPSATAVSASSRSSRAPCGKSSKSFRAAFIQRIGRMFFITRCMVAYLPPFVNSLLIRHEECVVCAQVHNCTIYHVHNCGRALVQLTTRPESCIFAILP